MSTTEFHFCHNSLVLQFLYILAVFRSLRSRDWPPLYLRQKYNPPPEQTGNAGSKIWNYNQLSATVALMPPEHTLLQFYAADEGTKSSGMHYQKRHDGNGQAEWYISPCKIEASFAKWIWESFSKISTQAGKPHQFATRTVTLFDIGRVTSSAHICGEGGFYCVLWLWNGHRLGYRLDDYDLVRWRDGTT